MKSDDYNIGHTLITPLPDGRVSYTPCRHCGDPCRGHSVAVKMEATEVYTGSWCRTCGKECPRAQCDACRADGASSEREEERAAVVAWLRKQSVWRCVTTDCADAIERGEHR